MFLLLSLKTSLEKSSSETAELLDLEEQFPWSRRRRRSRSTKIEIRIGDLVLEGKTSVHKFNFPGKVSLSWIQSRPRLLLTDPELCRLILSDKSGHFIKRPLNPLVDLLQKGVSTLEGEKWAKRRKLITPAFHLENLKGMVPAFSSCCVDLINKWKKSITSSGTCEIDVAPEFQNLAGDVIARTAFGSCFEEAKIIFELQKEQLVLVLEAFQSIYFPGLRFIPTKKNRRRYSIEYRQDLLLQCKEQSGNDLTIEDIIEECKLFYFAGKETTAIWLTWTMIVLSMHTNWQEKAREEVLRTCGNKVPNVENLNNLKIVSMILNEVLRLYPPATVQVRHTIKKTNIGRMSIPSGVDIWLPTLFFHHDPEYWGDNAGEFKPERFAEGVSKGNKGSTKCFLSIWLGS
ncbi:hypothetical protein EZV62_006679 [Acer yangbiense]|uniref:Cytochrome P450 n=1 Tax=Acer yangbiense TaxID=1000413 RepID=A0A5C7I8A1_9ROSI|nr:hypothetical protein EZV62_006679 [Acer yangbiense]